MSDGMAWGPIDFLLAGGLLAGAGATREVAAARGSTTYRLAAGVATGTLLLLVWALLAVGVAGREGDARDLLYVVVPCVAVAGAARARLRPRGMAAAMLAAAVAQAGVGTVLVAVGGEDTDPAALLAITGMFVALFLGSAGTFLRAARTPSGPTAIPGTPTGGPGDE